jgi:CheY-like chemotaxis protein
MVVQNGREALVAWESFRPDVILMDVQMPVMDGLEATRAIRAHEGGGGRTPIIAITANALPEQKVEGLSAGVDIYLTKPLRLQQLREALQKVCLPTDR